MVSLADHKTEIRDLYAEALLAVRLRGIEGRPARELAVLATVAAVRERWETAAGAEDIRALLRVSDRAPFSMCPETVPFCAAGRQAAGEPLVDQHMNALLSQLDDAVRRRKV